MKDLIYKKNIATQIIENHDLDNEELEFMIETLEIIKDRIVDLVEKKIDTKK